MIVRSIQFTNLRSFKEASVTFGKCNHITGRNLDNEDNNGTGKTTLISSILLLLGGAKFADINLAKFVRNQEKSAKLKGEIEVKGNIIEIERVLRSTGSSTLKLKINGEDPECKTSKDYQNLLFEHIGDADSFKKFRLLDTNNGINILDFTSGQLRKSLMSMCQEKFDVIRAKFLDKKKTFEKYNKELIVSKHAPSENRLQIVMSAIQHFDKTKWQNLMKQIQEHQMDKNKLLTERGKFDQDKTIKGRQLQKMQSLGTCPTCLQTVTDEYKAPIIKDLHEKIKLCDKKIIALMQDIQMYNEILAGTEKERQAISVRKEKLSLLKYKLESRIAQKDYKYTDQDIEIAKKAIAVIDEFANFYLVEWVNVIEPIVNSYISKLQMSMHFGTSDKNNIEITIKRGEQTYTYDQLSNGEKIFISTIFKIALLLEQQEQGCMFADESFDCLSYENLNRLVNIVSDLPVQLMFVTHQENFKNLNAKTTFIEKKEGVSRIK